MCDGVCDGIAVTSSQVGELRELQTICREYVAGLRLELLRKQTSEPARAVELAAYFTHCSLQPAHTMLALNSAMKLAYKAKLFNSAASFARRLLEFNPKPELGTQARKVIQMCDATPDDAFTLKYDARNPFVLCNATFVPVYKGSMLARCAFCKVTAPRADPPRCAACRRSARGVYILCAGALPARSQG